MSFGGILKKSIGAGLVLVFAGSMMSLPANAVPGAEDPMDPCFDASFSGTVSRTATSQSNWSGDWSNSNNRLDGEMVALSNQLVRVEYGYRYFNKNSGSGLQDTYRIFYDSNSNEKTVVKTTSKREYFSESLYQYIAGWLVDEDGNNSTWVTSRTRPIDNYSSTRERISKSTTVLQRNCSGFDSQEPGSGEVFEVNLNSSTAETLLVPTFSAHGIKTAQITIESGSFPGAGKLKIWNDQNAVSNPFGYSSLAFQIVSGNGSEVKLLKPITVAYEDAPNALMAHSSDGGNWASIDSLSTSSVSNSTSGSIEIKSLPVGTWLYVGQKAEQAESTVYADRFSIEVGGSAKITSTGGSGTGLVNYFSATPSVCEVRDEELVGVSPGECELVANKQGFDGYANKMSQTIRLTVEK